MPQSTARAKKNRPGIIPKSTGTRNMEIFRNLARGLLLLALSSPIHATDFSLEDMRGKMHRLEDYRGKWVLVNFWATWCPPCLSEIPELSSLHDAHKDSDLVVIGIAMDSGSARKVTDFAEAHEIGRASCRER